MLLDISWTLIGINFAAILTISILMYTFFYYHLTTNNIKREKVVCPIKKFFAKNSANIIKVFLILLWSFFICLFFIKLISYINKPWVIVINLFGWFFFILEVYLCLLYLAMFFNRAVLSKRMIEEKWDLRKILKEFKITEKEHIIKIVKKNILPTKEIEDFVLDYVSSKFK